MKQDTSVRHQNELYRQLSELNETYQSQQQELTEARAEQAVALRQEFDKLKHEFTCQLSQQKEEIQQAYQQQTAALEDECATRWRIAKNEFEGKIAATANTSQTAKKDGEYDWFLAKQRLKKNYEADVAEAQENYKNAKNLLKAYGSEFSDLVEMAKAALRRHRCELKVQGGDLLEAPAPGDHLKEHLQSYRQVEELSRQFQKATWVRFQEDRWYLIAFMLGMVLAAYPLYLMLGNYPAMGVGTTVIGFLVSLIAYYASRAMASKVASQFRPSFVTVIANGKKQLLSAQHQNKHGRDLQLARIKEEAKSSDQELDQQWLSRKNEIDTRVEQREQELRAWIGKQKEAIESQQQSKQSDLDNLFQPRLQDLDSRLAQETRRRETEERQQENRHREEFERKTAESAAAWKATSSALLSEIQHAHHLAQKSCADAAQPDWQPMTAPLNTVRVGEIIISDDVASVVIPVGMDLVHCPSILVETSGVGSSDANHVLNLALMRLFTSLPPGKLQATIVDPIGLGQSFSAFMHLADHDEQLVNHRIWTESGYINTRLAELTQHMENVIQTYLRNEFQSMQEYNRHAGEVAEAFRVLVVSNFPNGFF